jgi:hypothetical protein
MNVNSKSFSSCIVAFFWSRRVPLPDAIHGMLWIGLQDKLAVVGVERELAKAKEAFDKENVEHVGLSRVVIFVCDELQVAHWRG